MQRPKIEIKDFAAKMDFCCKKAEYMRNCLVRVDWFTMNNCSEKELRAAMESLIVHCKQIIEKVNVKI